VTAAWNKTAGHRKVQAFFLGMVRSQFERRSAVDRACRRFNTEIVHGLRLEVGIGRVLIDSKETNEEQKY
jgi:hypothetical protein